MMKGMKKEGKGMNEAKKRGKKCLACLLVLLFVIGTTIAPAAVAKGDGKAFEELNDKLAEVDDNPFINSFLYDRMLEYDNTPDRNLDEGIKAVNITVIESHWWRAKKEVKTFYVVRNDTSQQIDIRNDYDEGDGDSLWIFYPTIEQTIHALDMIISCSEDCMTDKKAVHSLVRLGILTVTVDKSDNVPGITEIITNSPWAKKNLPDSAIHFLEWFESHH
jgi:hypothetical protein